MSDSIHAAPRTGGVRFAPSPTGRFHVGNLRTAWVSFQFARTLVLPWIVRYEDIDRPRVLAGALEQQRADLIAFGMVADVELVQSAFHSRHLEVFEMARASGAVYPCACSRREVQTALAELASAPHDGIAPVYSGNCRAHPLSSEGARGAAAIAWRFKMPLEDGRDDFIVARTNSVDDNSSFAPAYHWACAIDDFDGGYDLIVRSSDLGPAMPLQRAIQEWLAHAESKPPYPMRAFHTALVTQDNGVRLEKRTLGVTLPELVAGGWDEIKIWRAFEKSFDTSLFTEVHDVSHERLSVLKLSDLLSNDRAIKVTT
jgi:glutamyl/glutaminyl-tRNA synthetase